MSMSNYGWIIDKDHVEDRFNAFGEITPVMGPSTISADVMRRLMNGEGNHFRMLDDDGELYYEGRLIQDEGEDCVFSPLDDYGRPNA
jgi:hypothetical protein